MYFQKLGTIAALKRNAKQNVSNFGRLRLMRLLTRAFHYAMRCASALKRQKTRKTQNPSYLCWSPYCAQYHFARWNYVSTYDGVIDLSLKPRRSHSYRLFIRNMNLVLFRKKIMRPYDVRRTQHREGFLAGVALFTDMHMALFTNMNSTEPREQPVSKVFGRNLPFVPFHFHQKLSQQTSCTRRAAPHAEQDKSLTYLQRIYATFSRQNMEWDQ